MLEAIGKFNRLSPDLRKEIETKGDKAGRYVKYRFDIARLNPDGQQTTGGQYIYPLLYTLTPVTFEIIDPYDKGRKRIGLVRDLKEHGASEDSFHRISIKEGWQGIYTIDMEKPHDRDVFAFLELHPKMQNGRFRDFNAPGIVTRIDEVAEATTLSRLRNVKVEAMFVASSFNAQQVRDFAAAMNWNESDDLVILKNRIEAIAESDPVFFKEFIDSKNIEYRAVLKRAMDKNIIAYLPVESKFVWVSNGQPIAVLERVEGGKYLDRMCDWVLTSKNGMEVFQRIKGLLSSEKIPA